MKAILKQVYSPDIDDLGKYLPENPRNFSFLLRAMIGPEDKDGEESFDIEVCTPQWLEETYQLTDVIIGRHHLIVREYNYERIICAINNFLQHCSGDNWKAIAEKISQLGHWEFEDYIE